MNSFYGITTADSETYETVMTLPGKDLKVLRHKYYVTVRNSEMIDYTAIEIS